MIVAHEIAHLAVSPQGGILEREADGWIFHPSAPPSNGEAIILQSAAGCVGERVFELGNGGAEALLTADCKAFFETAHVSPDDMMIIRGNEQMVAALIKQHMLIDRIMTVFVDIGLDRLKSLQRRMEATPVGGQLEFGPFDMERPWEAPETVH